MSHLSELIGQDIQAYLHKHQYKGLLRFLPVAALTMAKAPS